MSDKPHDTLTTHFLQRPGVAQDMLRFVLPPKVCDTLDLTTLRSSELKLTDDQLSEIKADFILEAETVNGGDVLIFVILEHQSTVNARMAYRMTRYTVRLWESWLAQKPGAKRFPAVVPAVLYHGEARWNAATNIGELIEAGELRDAMGPFWPSFGYVLKWIDEHPEEEIFASDLQVVSQLLLLSLAQSRGAEDVESLFRRWTPLLRKLVNRPGGIEDVGAVVVYFNSVREVVNLDAVRKEVRAIDARLEDAVMTAAEKLREEGRVKGRVEGLAEGLAEGRAEGLTEGLERGRLEQHRVVLRRQLIKKFGELPQPFEHRIEAASMSQLTAWSDAFASAHRLEDVFSDHI